MAHRERGGVTCPNIERHALGRGHEKSKGFTKALARSLDFPVTLKPLGGRDFDAFPNMTGGDPGSGCLLFSECNVANLLKPVGHVKQQVAKKPLLSDDFC